MVACALVLASHQPARRYPPLVDAYALAAHADSEGVPRAAAYALAWMESRDGSCLPRCPRGVGVAVAKVDTTWMQTTTPLRLVWRVDTVRYHKCRAVGRMQINPCAGLDRQNPRCAFKRVRDSAEDNYACGLWHFGQLRKRWGSDSLGFARYLGTGRDANGTTDADYSRQAFHLVGVWFMAGQLSEEDRL